jgi:transposase
MIGSVRQDGGTACMTVEGAVNAEVFRSYVREILLPTLSAGDILVMDNLSAHKDHHALELLKNAGVTVRFLPAYSPDLNPIELMWSKVKALLRKAEAAPTKRFSWHSETLSQWSLKKTRSIGLPIAATALFKML